MKNESTSVSHTPEPNWRDLFPVSVAEIGHKYGDYTLVSGDIKVPVAYFQGPSNSESVRDCASFIVRACNSHEELVDALKLCEEVIRAQIDPEHIAHGRVEWASIRDRVSAVLSKVEGK